MYQIYRVDVLNRTKTNSDRVKENKYLPIASEKEQQMKKKTKKTKCQMIKVGIDLHFVPLDKRRKKDSQSEMSFEL